MKTTLYYHLAESMVTIKQITIINIAISAISIIGRFRFLLSQEIPCYP